MGAGLWPGLALRRHGGQLLDTHISNPEVRSIAAYAALFIAGLLTGALLTHLLTEWIRGSFLDGIDRTLGGAIGFVRALLFTCFFLAVASVMGAKQDRWWTQSMFIPHIEWLAEDLKLLIPERWLERMKPAPENVPTVQKKH
ncbi:MAG: CvpA family protein [Rhizobium sp.]|nr:MAG: CvpA family protein [Rhizobium sp.]